jgi:hypothetical protein
MKLYRSPLYSTRWFAFDPKMGWVMFPAEIKGWLKRQPVQGIDLTALQEVPLRLGFNTGIFIKPGSVAPSSGLRREVAA